LGEFFEVMDIFRTTDDFEYLDNLEKDGGFRKMYLFEETH
jgi:hypothetical protein